MILPYWPPYFRALFGGSWPRSYCCVDLETTGYAFDRDVITEYGHVLVEDGRIVDRLTLLLDWTKHALVPDHWLRSRIESVRQQMALAGKACHTSYERLAKEGMPPEKALVFINNFLTTLKQKGMVFAAHNGDFDEKMLAGNLAGFRVDPKGFSFGDNGLLDTAGIEKANQCIDNPRMHPKRGDTLRSYFHRVKYTRVEGVKYALDTHCHARYAFAEAGITRDNMHGAETDAYCVHLLMEKFREHLTRPQEAPVFPSAEHREARQALSAPPLKVRSEFPLSTQRIRGQRVN